MSTIEKVNQMATEHAVFIAFFCLFVSRLKSKDHFLLTQSRPVCYTGMFKLYELYTTSFVQIYIDR